MASSKEQSAHHLSAATADSVYDKLRMFNGQAAAAAGWAWYGAAAGGPTSHLGLGGHHNPTSHPALTSHQFGGSVGSNGGSSGDRESADEKKHHLSGKRLVYIFVQKTFCTIMKIYEALHHRLCIYIGESRRQIGKSLCNSKC